MDEENGRRLVTDWVGLAEGGALRDPDVVPLAHTQIVFIDGSLQAASILAHGVKPGVIAVILDPAEDGVAQIADYLVRHEVRDAAAIDIVAHGVDGVIRLGSTVLSVATIQDHLSQLARIGEALQPGGDILLYGCDVAQDAAGTEFLQQLSLATGGANIAASSHVIGSADSGGDWNLDVDVGTIDVASPFTATALADVTEILPVATNQLFVTFNSGLANALTRIEQIGVSGTSLVGSPLDVHDGTQTTSFAFLQGLVVDAPAGQYFTVNSDNTTVNQIVKGSVAGGAPSVLYSAPDIPNYQFGGMALDPASHTIYFAQASTDPAQDGIYKISESGGTPTAVVVNQGIQVPLNMSLDIGNGLVFFVDNFGIGSGVNNLDVGNIATGKVTVLNSQLGATVLSDIDTNAGQLTGVAADTISHTLYFTAENGLTLADNFIFRVPYTVNAGAVTLGTVTTMYSGSGAGHPGDIAIDPTNGVFYTGDLTNQAINAGSLSHSGAGSVNQLFQLTGTAGVQPNGLFFLSTPTVAASGSVSFVQGGSAVTLAPGLTVGNPDGQGLASATVQVAGGSFAIDGDTLAANTAGTAIVTSYNAANETLTLSGADTVAHYQTVLQSVTFNSTGATGGNRTIDWTVSNGIISSSTPTSSVTVHDKPIITAGAATTFVVDRSPVALDSALAVTDPDSAILNGATISIGIGFALGDTLGFSNQNGILGAYNAGTGVLTLSGAASVANYQTALQSVTYGFTGDPTTDTRTISWIATDGVATSDTATSTLAIDHAPTVVAGASVTYPQNGVPVVLDPGLTVSDSDNALLNSATISISSGFLVGDVLNFTNQNGISGSYNGGSGVLMLSGSVSVAFYQAALQSVSYSFSGDPTNGGADPDRTITWLVSDGVTTNSAAASAVHTLCFCAGTRMATPAGETAVERLATGDLILTQDGRALPIRWIGTGQCLLVPGRRCESTPVIVRAGALEDGVPRRDLRITRGHSLYLDGVLVPVEHLINHRTILWDDAARSAIVYHLELDTHEVLLAEGAAAESYRDDGNRADFHNANPRWDVRPPIQPLAPIVTGGPQVVALWRRLLARAGEWPAVALTGEPDLHLLVDGARLAPVAVADGIHSFELDDIGDEVRLASRSGVPSEHGFNCDHRRLGVAVRRIVLRRAGMTLEIAAESPLLADGFHGYEPDGGFRWTDGAGLLPRRAMVAFAGGGLCIEVHIGCTARYAAHEAELTIAA